MIVLGDQRTGKTSICHKYVFGEIDSEPSVATQFYTKSVEVGTEQNPKELRLHIYDNKDKAGR